MSNSDDAQPWHDRERAQQEPAREALRALHAVWLIAYRHMPNDRHALDQIGDCLDVLLERYGTKRSSQGE